MRNLFSVRRLGRALVLTGIAAGFGAGCNSGPRTVSMPGYDPAGMAGRALVDYDKNRDGKIDAEELKKCPALKGALAEVDKDKDGCLSADEIADRLRQFQASNTGLMTVSCRVTRDGQGVPGVTVNFIPEAFMGDTIKPASGESAADGSVGLSVPGAAAPGISPGYYRIEALLKSGGPIETKTPLGQEVSPVIRGEILVRLSP